MKTPLISKIYRLVLSSILFSVLAISLLFAHPDPSHAARGGRVGGGSFSAPSIPRTGGGGYRGGYGGGYGGYRGGGMGFPFLLPIFGFGGGGLFGFLILMAITGVIVNSIRGTNPSLNDSKPLPSRVPLNPSTSIVQIQLGLLASAKGLQEDLRKLAYSSDTSSSKGLQLVLQETTLSLLRQPHLWVYANAEEGKVPFSNAEATFNRLSMTERSKLQAEITSNVSGNIQLDELKHRQSGDPDSINEYIAITILIASKSPLKINNGNNVENIQETLRILGSISSDDLMALEVIWQPEGEGDVLSAEELVISYPNLKRL